MEDFAGKIAVVTGGGTGIGRELARRLAAEGCHVAICDVSREAMLETQRLCESEGRSGIRITTHIADVSDEAQMVKFRDEVETEQATDKIHLLFNNAGVGGGGSMFTNTRDEWDRTFGICWGGVYLGVRTFLPMLVRAPEGRIVNVSSINGEWATVGPDIAHTAYSAAKFAVRGFSEALMIDLRINAPHVKCSVVMPGHIGTALPANSRRVHTGGANELRPEDIAAVRVRLSRNGVDVSRMSDQDIAAMGATVAQAFHDNAPTTAARAAEIICEGVRDGRWRILVGDDARIIDERVRANPEDAYTPEFHRAIVRDAGWKLG